MLNPFEYSAENSHIWEGKKAIIWYQERLSGSFSIIILYHFDGKYRRLTLELNNKNQKVEFKNDELPVDHFNQLVKEMKLIKDFISPHKD